MGYLGSTVENSRLSKIASTKHNQVSWYFVFFLFQATRNFKCRLDRYCKYAEYTI